eukprot:s2152_g16.t1
MTAAYETWHLVDIAQVVCPAPTVSATAPAFPAYNVGINYTSAMVVDAPHIVSFMRTSNKAVSITFKIEDANGAEVVPQTTVNLAAIATTVPNTCTCTNPTIPTAVQATYGTNYGTSCSAWDEQLGENRQWPSPDKDLNRNDLVTNIVILDELWRSLGELDGGCMVLPPMVLCFLRLPRCVFKSSHPRTIL